MNNKDVFPTIEQSLKMIEEKLKTQKEKKGKNKDTNLLKKRHSIFPQHNAYRGKLDTFSA